MEQEKKVISELALYSTSKNIDGEIMYCIKHSDVKQFAHEVVKNLTIPVVTNCTEIEAPYFDKKGREIKEFALLKLYHFFGVNDQGRGRKHHYMYKWVCLEEYKGKKYWSALHLTKGDGGKFRLRAVADKQTRIIAHAEIIQSY